MDFSVWQLLGLIFLLLVTAYATYLYITWPFSYFRKIGVVEPKNPYNDLKDRIEHVEEVFRMLANMGFYEVDVDLINKYGKVLGTWIGWIPAYLIADTDMLREIFIKDFEHFCDRRRMPMRGNMIHSLLDVQGHEPFKRQRTILSRYFSSGKNKMSTPGINKSIDIFISLLQKNAIANQPIEIKKLCNLFTIDVMCRTAFGVDIDCLNNHENILVKKAKKLFEDSMRLSLKFIITLFTPNLNKLLEKLHFLMVDSRYFEKLIAELIKQRELSEQATPDFIDTLIKARIHEGKEKGFTDDEVIANGVLFLLAGFDNVASTLAFLLYNLTVNEECQEKVYKEIQAICGDKVPNYDDIQQMEYLEMCNEENLRLFPIATRLERMCVKDTVVKGIPIKKGTSVGLSVWYFHRSPEIWHEPEKFIPERFLPEAKESRDPFHYCPFGIGPRHCIGMRLAMLEVKLSAVRILQNFKIVKNDKTQVPLKMDYKAFVLTAKDGVWLTLLPRQQKSGSYLGVNKKDIIL